LPLNSLAHGNSAGRSAFPAAPAETGIGRVPLDAFLPFQDVPYRFSFKVLGTIKMLPTGRAAVAIRCVIDGESGALTVNAPDSLTPVSRTPQIAKERSDAYHEGTYSENKENENIGANEPRKQVTVHRMNSPYLSIAL
jgi:hypothetical protein